VLGESRQCLGLILHRHEPRLGERIPEFPELGALSLLPFSEGEQGTSFVCGMYCNTRLPGGLSATASADFCAMVHLDESAGTSFRANNEIIPTR
jgi:hypothetical protein